MSLLHEYIPFFDSLYIALHVYTMIYSFIFFVEFIFIYWFSIVRAQP